MKGYYDDTFTIVLRDICLVVGAMLTLGFVMLGIAYVFSWWMDRHPPKARPERYPVGWWLPQDEVVRVVEPKMPYDQDLVNDFTSNAFDWAGWEMKFDGSGYAGG